MQVVDRLRPITPIKLRRMTLAARFKARQPTSRHRVLPDFLIIGAQRCGTSSLYRYLAVHPCVMPSLRKEVEYFSRRYNLGLDWYKVHFPTKTVKSFMERFRRGTILTFEATPDYVFHPYAAERAHQLVPDAKIILLLRDPVKRAYSHYHHMVRLGFETMSFENALAAEPARLEGDIQALEENPLHYCRPYLRYSYFHRGVYVDQLQPWMDLYGRERLLILRAEDLFVDPAKIYREVLSFVGLQEWQPAYFGNFGDAKGQTEAISRMRAETRAELTSRFHPHNEKLYETIGRDLGWQSTP